MTRAEFVIRIGKAAARAINAAHITGPGYTGPLLVREQDHAALGESIAAEILCEGFFIADPMSKTQLRKVDA